MKKINYFIICSFLFGVFLLSSSSFLLNETLETYPFENTEIAVTVDGVAKTTIPDKNSGKAVSSIVCDKGATGIWNYDYWTLNIKNMTSTRTRCQINFVSKYNEPLLNGTDPVLSEGLIPVTIDNNGIVKKASLGSKWYSYQEKQWANAVILLDSSILYADGETIPESNIESYFV